MSGYYNRGVTLIELLLVMAMTITVIMALVAVMSSGYVWPRFVIEQGAITTTARLRLGRMSDVLREGMVTSASPSRVVVATDSGPVIFSLTGTELSRGPTTESLQVVGRGIRNNEPVALLLVNEAQAIIDAIESLEPLSEAAKSTQSLITDVREMTDLSDTDTDQLVLKLELAIQQFGLANVDPAIIQLGLFISKVDLLVSQGKLTYDVLPLFTYYSYGGAKALELDPALAPGNIDRVFIQLAVDNLPDQRPGRAVFETEVTLR